jgi:hypothetical protein
MNTVFARAILALGLFALPAVASASTKDSAKHNHTVAKKDPIQKKKGKHHGHKSNGSKAVAATPGKTSVAAKAALSAPASDDSSPKAQ